MCVRINCLLLHCARIFTTYLILNIYLNDVHKNDHSYSNKNGNNKKLYNLYNLLFQYRHDCRNIYFKYN